MELLGHFSDHFGTPPQAVAVAPGRVNLIGEHTDYNGGRVLPAAIALETRVALRMRGDLAVCGVSREAGSASAPLEDPARGDWLDYPRGVALELVRDGRLPERGFDVAVASDVPSGAGLSSSAALEAATALALLGAAGRPPATEDLPALALLCQRAEVGFVGVPCGVMDPFAVLLARAGSALLLDCSDLQHRSVPIPDGLELLILDTGVAHALREGGYAQRVEECRRALEGSRARLGRDLATLSELSEADLEQLRDLDPTALARARHVVSENARVTAFAEALEQGDERAAGLLMFESHASLRADYEVTCAESDLLVATSRELPHVLGARMTGAGWGGCTVHLVRAGHGGQAAASLGERFRSAFGRTPRHWTTRPAAAAHLLTVE